MRTTLTLDPDVAMLVKVALEREQATLKTVVNDGLRRGLRSENRGVVFQVIAHESALAPGFDPRAFNQVAEELEDDVLISRWPTKTK